MTTMAAFQRAAAKAPLKPAMVVLVEPSDFADECPRRPQTAIAVGLRRLSELNEQGAKIEAAKRIRKQWPDDIEQADPTLFADYANDAIMCVVLGRAVCDPNNIEAGHLAFPFAEDRLSEDLTREGIKRLWQEYLRHCAESSPVQRALTDEQIQLLADDLIEQIGALHILGPAREKSLRRLLGFVADELEDLIVSAS